MVSDKEASNFRMSPGGREGARTGTDGTFRAVGLDDGVHELRVADVQGTIPWAKPTDKAKPKAPIEVTLDDAEAYTKAWTVKLAWRLVPDTDLIESICEENSKDVPHMVGK